MEKQVDQLLREAAVKAMNEIFIDYLLNDVKDAFCEENKIETTDPDVPEYYNLSKYNKLLVILLIRAIDEGCFAREICTLAPYWLSVYGDIIDNHITLLFLSRLLDQIDNQVYIVVSTIEETGEEICRNFVLSINGLNEYDNLLAMLEESKKEG